MGCTGITLSISSFCSPLSTFRAVFHISPPHSSLFVAFLPFLECIFPRDSAKGLCSAQVWGCRRAVRTRWGAPLHRLAPAIDTEPHAWRCEGSANVLLFHVVLAEDVLQVSFSLSFKNSLLRIFFFLKRLNYFLIYF